MSPSEGGRIVARRDRREAVRPLDPWLVLAAMALAVTGIIIIDSASQSTTALAGLPRLYYVQRQVIWAALGAVVFTIMAAVDYHVWARFTWVFYGLAVVTLGFVLVHGHSALGAQRWIQIGSFQFQPSELAKLLLVGTLAGYLARRAGKMRRIWEMGVPLLLVGLLFALVYKQPDLGTGLILVFILIGMLYMADTKVWHLLLVFGGGFALFAAAIYAHVNYHTPLPGIHQYQLNRLLIFLHPQTDPTGAGWSITQSQIALGSGGLFGTGLFAGAETQMAFLPEPFTDFVFASLAEQLGLVGAAAVLTLFLVLLWRGLAIAAEAPDVYGTLLAGGVVTALGSQLIMNVGMAVGLMPVVGVPLPFLSYGGTSLVVTAASLGLLASVGRAGRRTVAQIRPGYETLPEQDQLDLRA
jgi:rod shape determining protein RodA